MEDSRGCRDRDDNGPLSGDLEIETAIGATLVAHGGPPLSASRATLPLLRRYGDVQGQRHSSHYSRFLQKDV